MKGWRNWWITGNMDGRKTAVAMGPKTDLDAGFDLTVYQSDNKESIGMVSLRGFRNRKGKLQLTVEARINGNMQHVADIITDR